jgi:hypothetical protein
MSHTADTTLIAFEMWDNENHQALFKALMSFDIGLSDGPAEAAH